MNRQKLVADFRRMEVRPELPARVVQQEVFDAVAAGDVDYARIGARVLTSLARRLLRRAYRDETKREALTSLGLVRGKGGAFCGYE